MCRGFIPSSVYSATCIHSASDCLEVVQSVSLSSMGKYGAITKEIKTRRASFDKE
jgi:hypothetical protein